MDGPRLPAAEAAATGASYLLTDRAALLSATLGYEEDADRGGGGDLHLHLVELASRMWLDLDGRPAGVEGRLAAWCRRHPTATTARFALVRTAVRTGGVGAGWRALEQWQAPHVVGDHRWWADRLVGAVAAGTLDRPVAVGAAVTARDDRRWRRVLAPWAEHLAASVVRVTAESRSHLVVVHGLGAEAAAAGDRLARHLDAVGVRLLRCDLDSCDAANPLDGWLDALWDDVQWNLLGSRNLARLAPVVDRHLGRVAAEGLDRRRSDDTLVEVTARLLAAVRVPTVVLAHGSAPALRWLDRFLARLRASAPEPLLAVTDVRLPGAAP